jgi:hypothetical protein
MLTVVAVLGSSPDHGTEQAATGQVATVPAPATVAVTRRQPTASPTAGRRPGRPSAARRPAPASPSAPHTTTGPS